MNSLLERVADNKIRLARTRALIFGGLQKQRRLALTYGSYVTKALNVLPNGKAVT